MDAGSDDIPSSASPRKTVSGGQNQKKDAGPKAYGAKCFMHGNMYQVRLIMLFLQAAFNKNYRYELDSEKVDAGKLEDIIFFNENDGQYRFLQAKHTLRPGKKKITMNSLTKLKPSAKNIYGLQQYFDSFLKLNQKEKYKQRIKDIIICTNIDFDVNVKKNYVREVTDFDDILNVGGNRYKFLLDKNEEIVGVLRSQSNMGSTEEMEDMIKDFFAKLIFAVNQPSEEDLGKLIKLKIMNKLNDLIDVSSKYQAEIIYNEVEKEVIDWWKSCESRPLTQKENFFQIGEEKLKGVVYSIPILFHKYTIENTEVVPNYESVNVKKLENDFLQSPCVQVFHILTAENTFDLINKLLSSIKHDVVHNFKMLLLINKEFGAIANFFRKNLLMLFYQNKDRIDSDEITKFFQSIMSLPSDQNRKLIMVSEKNSDLEVLFKEKEPNCFSRFIIDKIDIEDFDKDFLKELLVNKRVTYQGHEQSLAELLGTTNVEDPALEQILNSSEKILNLYSLSELIFNENIVIGMERPDFTDRKSPYYDEHHVDIERKLNLQVIKELDVCLKNNKSDVFAFENIETSELRGLIDEVEGEAIRTFPHTSNEEEDFYSGRLYVLREADPENDFEELKKNLAPGTKIHYLSKFDDSSLPQRRSIFFLKYSTNISEARKFVNDFPGIKLNNLIRFNHFITIIAGEPGAGKSTALTTLSQNLDSLIWPIRINLKDFEAEKELKCLNELEGIVNFFLKIGIFDKENPFSNSFFRYCFKQGRRIVLLLDGYDEIKECQRMVQTLMSAFSEKKLKVFLTTRKYDRLELETKYKVFSYELMPFTREEQEQFLIKFWSKSFKIEESKKESKITEFTKKLLHGFDESILLSNESLIEIALQAKMVATIFSDKCKDYLDSGTFSCSEKLASEIHDESDLYKTFVERQYERYIVEKKNIPNMSSLQTGSFVLTKFYTKVHGLLALKMLFPEEEPGNGVLNKKLLHKISEDEFRGLGLLKNLQIDNGTISFIHQTYAEYFLAKLFVNWLKKSLGYAKYVFVRELLLKNIFYNRNKLISSFMELEVNKKSKADGGELRNRWSSIKSSRILKKCARTPFGCSFSAGSFVDRLKKDKNRLYMKSLKISDSSLDRSTFPPIDENIDFINLEDNVKFLISRHEGKEPPLLYHYFSCTQAVIRDTIKHYFMQAFFLKMIANDYTKELLEIAELYHMDEFKFRDFKDTVEALKDSEEDLCKLQKLVDHIDSAIPQELLPTKDIFNNFFPYLILHLKDDEINKINADSWFQIACQRIIINLLENICCEYGIETHKHPFSEIILDSETFRPFRTFCAAVTLHENIISSTLDALNVLFEYKHGQWIRENGVYISYYLKVLTPKMSKRFIEILGSDVATARNIGWFISHYDDTYIARIFYRIICNFTREMQEDFGNRLPHVDKMALLEMLKEFIDYSHELASRFPFNDAVLLIESLKFVECVLKQNRDPSSVRVGAEYLLALHTWGLNLVNFSNDKLLVLDPPGTFRCFISLEQKEKLVESIKQKLEQQKEEELSREIEELVEWLKKELEQVERFRERQKQYCLDLDMEEEFYSSPRKRKASEGNSPEHSKKLATSSQ